MIDTPRRWRCELSLRSLVFGFGISFEDGVEVYLGLGPLVLGWGSWA